MNNLSQVESARAFARSLNILLKYARLYGLEHQRTRAQSDIAWSELQRAAAPETGLLLGTADAKLLIDGVPMEGHAERSFAALLTTANIASLHFTYGVQRSDLDQLLRAFHACKTSELAQQLKATLGESGAIRINEIRFVADSDLGIAEQLTARTLADRADNLVPWLQDPEKLLQLIAAADGSNSGGGGGENGGGESGTGGGSGSGGAGADLFEEESVTKTLRLLTSMSALKGKPDAESSLMRELAQEKDACRVLRKIMIALPVEGEDEGLGTNTLKKLAERLAIRFAMQQFERGDVKVNAVHELMERMGKEIESLRTVLSAHEGKLVRAGVAVESYADILDRKFWASIPEQGKKSVLLSDDGWCIPARNIRSYVEELIAKGDRTLAEEILRNCLRQLANPDLEARRKTAGIISELADLFDQVSPGLLADALRQAGMRICSEESLELQTLLGAAYVRLTQEAAQQRDYPAIMQSLNTLDRLQEYRPRTANEVRPRVTIDHRLRGFIADAVQQPTLPDGIVPLLAQVPVAAAQEIALQFGECTLRSLANRYVELAQAVGKSAIDCLQSSLRTAPAGQMIGTAALLSRLRPEIVEQELPTRIRTFSRSQQDAVVRALGAAGAPQRGRLLLQLLQALDPLLLPEALDEIGFAGDVTVADKLMALAAGEGLGDGRPFVRLKAIESLGRLGASDAISFLTEMLAPRGLFASRRSRELQLTAARALLSLAPERVSSLLTQGGFGRQELAVGALAPVISDWVRQRRYPRVEPEKALSVLALTPKGKCTVEVARLSLGGGLIAADHRLPRGGEAVLEWPSGLSRLRSHVVLRHQGTRELAFEVMDIELDARSRLRRLIIDHAPESLVITANGEIAVTSEK